MKKSIWILIMLLIIVCLPNFSLAASAIRKVAKTSTAKETSIKILSNGAETKDSFVFIFSGVVFFTPPFETKLPNLPIAMEAKRFNDLENNEPSQDVEIGDILKPGIVYALRILDFRNIEYKVVLNRFSTTSSTKHAKLNYEEINNLISFLTTHVPTKEEEQNIHFNEFFKASEFILIPMRRKLKYYTKEEIPLKQIYQDNFNDKQYRLLGIARTQPWWIESHEIFVDTPYSFNDELPGSDIFFKEFRLQKTIPLFWYPTRDLMYSIMIIEDKTDKTTRDADANSAMIKADTITDLDQYRGKLAGKIVIFESDISLGFFCRTGCFL